MKHMDERTASRCIRGRSTIFIRFENSPHTVIDGSIVQLLTAFHIYTSQSEIRCEGRIDTAPYLQMRFAVLRLQKGGMG